MSAVMDSLDLAELESVDREAAVSILGEPRSVVLVVRLITVADIVDLDPPVTANIKDGWQWPVLFGGAVEVPGDVKTGTGLEDDFFYDDAIPLDGAGDLRLQISPGGKWLQSQHFVELATKVCFSPRPILDIVDDGSRPLCDATCFDFEILLQHLIAGRRFGRDVPEVVGHSDVS